ARPIDLFSVGQVFARPGTQASWRIYGEALRSFERGELDEAAELLATIGPSRDEIPANFLAEQVQREIDRAHRRRSTDRRNESVLVVIRFGSRWRIPWA